MAKTQTVERPVLKPPFGAPHVYVLAVINGDDPYRTHRVDRRETLVGRGDDVHFHLDDEEVSGHHFSLRVDGAICTIHELGSRNGTALNGRKLRANVSQRLKHLDEIQVGNTRILVLTGRFHQRPRRP